MVQAKLFGLKLLYFLAGAPVLVLLALISKKNLEGNPENFLLFALFGGLLVGGIVVQKKLWETGSMKTSKLESFTAVALVTAITLLIIRQIL